MPNRILLLFASALLLTQGDAETQEPAGSPAIVFDRIGGYSGGRFSINATVGWEFSVESPLTVTALGVWDNKLKGLAAETPVGLWDSTGDQLATATLPAGKAASEIDSFRYVSIDPVRLQAGQNYVIGAAYTKGTEQNIGGGNTSGKFFSDGAIRWVIRRSILREPGLAFPERVTVPPNIVATPGGFGPNFLVAEPSSPRIYHRTHRVDDERRYAMIRLPESDNGSHSRDLVVFVSVFAKKDGQLTQILVNGEPLGTGRDALKSLAATAKMLSDGVTKMAGVKPDIRIAAPSWIRYSDLTQIMSACGGRVDPWSSRTPALRVELATYRGAGMFLVNGDVEGRFVEKDECVEDTWTGLLWQKDGSTSGKKNYYQAAEYAASQKLNGLTGWRVPTIEELASVFPADDTPFVESGYVLDRDSVPAQQRTSYWTSELDTRSEDYAYLFGWSGRGGANNCYASRNYARVRCVRDVEPVNAATDTLASNARSNDTSRLRISGKRQIIRDEAVSGNVEPESVTIKHPQARKIVDFIRRNIIGKKISGRVVTGFDHDRMESVFERQTTFRRLQESQNGFGFDEVLEIRETIRPRGKAEKKNGSKARERQDNRRVILRHQYSVRRSTNEVVGYIREISHNEGQLSTAAVAMRSVVELSNDELIIRTSTVGYDDHITAKGFGAGAVEAQSKYSVRAGLLQRSQANEFFSVNKDSLARKPSRSETELIVATEVK